MVKIVAPDIFYYRFFSESLGICRPYINRILSSPENTPIETK